MGAVLAFAEGRVTGGGDSGHIDVVVRRSEDGGCTWGPLRVVADGDGDTRGNPAPVVDPGSGDVVLLSSYNGGEATEELILRGEVPADRGRRVFVQRSADDGRTFSAPREITARVKLPGWRWYATGPGHALALTRGPHAGRLVVPADHSAAPPAGSSDTGREPRYYGAHALLSDDGGRSWRLGFVDASHDGHVNANETTAAELPDGRIYLNTRDQLGTAPGNRADAVSGDGGATLARPFAPQPALDRVPVVQGSLLHAGGALLFSAPRCRTPAPNPPSGASRTTVGPPCGRWPSPGGRPATRTWCPWTPGRSACSTRPGPRARTRPWNSAASPGGADG